MPDRLHHRFPRPPRYRRRVLPLRLTHQGYRPRSQRSRVQRWAWCLREPALHSGQCPRNSHKRYPDWSFDTCDRKEPKP